MSTTRQLAAILFADIQGYTAIMQQDEARASIIRNKFKAKTEQETAIHNGRMVQYSGDGVLCVFNSAVEAIKAGIAIQLAMQQEPRVLLRIGIHTGDIVFEEENVYGDGVNVASRIESFAVAGSIFISARVYEDIKNHQDIQTVSLGKFELKNVEVPVELFAISNAGLVVPKREQLEGKGKQFATSARSRKKNLQVILPSLLVIAIAIFLLAKYFFIGNANADINSIAVLPFETLGKADADEFLSSGLAEEIRTQLSKVAVLKVIARASSAGYANSQKAPSVIGEELGVVALLTGSIQRQDSQIVVSVQLVNCKNNQQLWSEQYTRTEKNIFALQSEIAQQVVQKLRAKLTASDKNNLQQLPTTNALAYDYYLEAKNITYSVSILTDEQLAKMNILLDKAIQLDPDFIDAYRTEIEMNLVHFFLVSTGSEGNATIGKTDSLVQRLNEIAPDDPRTIAVRAIYKYSVFRDYAGAKEMFMKYVTENPNDAQAFYNLARCCKRLWQFDESLDACKKAIALDPRNCSYFIELRTNYYLKRDSANTRKVIEHALTICPDDLSLNTTLFWESLLVEGNTVKAKEILNKPIFQNAPDYIDWWKVQIFLIEGKIDSAILLDTQRGSKDTISKNSFDCFSARKAYYAWLKDDSVSAKKYSRTAISFMNGIVKKQPKNMELFRQLAECYAILKMETPCKENVKIYESLFPFKDEKVSEVNSTTEELAVNVLMHKERESLDLMKKLLELPFGDEGSVFLYRTRLDYRFLHNNPEYKKLVGE